MSTNLMPPEFAEVIATHKALFGGFTMMADESAAPAGEQQTKETVEPNTQTQQAPAENAPEQSGEKYTGAGSKDTLKAELVDERKKRQALESQVAELSKFQTGLTELLGGDKKDGEKPDPMAAISELRAELERERMTNTLREVIPQGVDANRVLKNTDFLASIDGLGAGDRAQIATKVSEFVNANPWVKTSQGGTSGDVFAGGSTAKPEPTPGVGRLAAAFEQIKK